MTKLAFVATSLIFCVCFFSDSASARDKGDLNASEHRVPEGLSASDWSNIKTAYESKGRAGA